MHKDSVEVQEALIELATTFTESPGIIVDDELSVATICCELVQIQLADDADKKFISVEQVNAIVGSETSADP